MAAVMVAVVMAGVMAALVIPVRWRVVTVVGMGPGVTVILLARAWADPGSQKVAFMAMSVVIAAGSQNVMSMLIATDSRSDTTAETASSIGALRSATTTTTLTAFITVIGYSGTVFGSGFTVPITTPTTIVGGYADRPS